MGKTCSKARKPGRKDRRVCWDVAEAGGVTRIYQSNDLQAARRTQRTRIGPRHTGEPVAERGKRATRGMLKREEGTKIGLKGNGKANVKNKGKRKRAKVGARRGSKGGG
jgi:hypothetical protein